MQNTFTGRHMAAILVGFFGATLIICVTIAGAAIYLKRQ